MVELYEIYQKKKISKYVYWTDTDASECLCCISLIGSTYLKTCYAFKTWVIDEIISMYRQAITTNGSIKS